MLHKTRLNFTHTQYQGKKTVWKHGEWKLLYSRIAWPFRGLLKEAQTNKYEGWNFNSGNYLFTTNTK